MRREALRKMLCKQYLTTGGKVKITGISLIEYGGQIEHPVQL